MMLSSMLSFKKLLKAVYVIRPGIQLIPYLAEEAAVDVSVVQSKDGDDFSESFKTNIAVVYVKDIF